MSKLTFTLHFEIEHVRRPYIQEFDAWCWEDALSYALGRLETLRARHAEAYLTGVEFPHPTEAK